MAEPLVIDGNLYCCRFKKECSAWLKAFSAALHSSRFPDPYERGRFEVDWTRHVAVPKRQRACTPHFYRG